MTGPETLPKGARPAIGLTLRSHRLRPPRAVVKWRHAPARRSPILHNLVFRQLFDAASSTYTYLLGDVRSQRAVYIDTVFEQHARDLALLRELGLTLEAVLDTHCHADHVTGA